MSAKNIFTLCALGATVALIQPAFASTKADAAVELLTSSMKSSLVLSEITASLDEKKITTVEAAAKLAPLAEQLELNNLELGNIFAQLSKEEYMVMVTELKGPETGKLVSAMEEMVKTQEAKLEKNKYYDSPELEKACKSYLAACKLFI